MLDSVIRYLAEMEVSKRLTLMSATLFWTRIVVIAFFLAAIITAQADIQVDRTAGPFAIRIWITNTIKESDAEQLQEISGELESAGVFDVWLDSKGGYVSAAIKIGKLIRKYDGITIVAENRKCYSSCALMFIAGVRRVISERRTWLASPISFRGTTEPRNS
jgi:hypothetical protein